MLKYVDGFKNQRQSTHDKVLMYFDQCRDAINRDNVLMLRKVCRYVAWVYIFMLALALLFVPGFRMTFAYYLMIPFLMTFFFVNLYIMEKKIRLSTVQIAILCGVFYVTICFLFIFMDVVSFPDSQALWTPMSMIIFPMVFIDKIYKYAIEELFAVGVYAFFAYIYKTPILFAKDLYMLLVAYVLSLLVARIILEMRSSEGFAMAELKSMSSFDKLTHVLNKGALLQKIDDYYFTKDRNIPCAMCVIDLDDFKLVNDNLGHSSGDILLERLGKLLLDSFRAYDIIGRYGGDEFVVFMPNMGDVDILQMRCRTLQMLLKEIYLGNGKPFTVSIGAIIDEGNHSKEELFMIADDALYKAKLDGKNCFTAWTIKEQEYSSKPLLIAIPGEENKGVAKLRHEEQDRFEIRSAGTGNDALRVISQYHSDIKTIILEMNVPDKGSEEILKYLKSREGFSNLPIIVVADTEENSIIAKDLGADEVLMFDSPDEQYKAAINRFVRNSNRWQV